MGAVSRLGCWLAFDDRRVNDADIGWRVQHLHASASELHGRAWPALDRPTAWVLSVDRPAVVLGSSQREEVVDRERASELGVDIVRRRSGGGAVWLAPAEQVWIDVFISRGDSRWHDDVGRSMDWLGDIWVAALAECGEVDGVVHRGPMQSDELSRLVCFAGLGPGEVTRHGRKIVGMSQRRTRDGARFQCSVTSQWPATVLGELVRLTTEDTTALQRRAAATEVPLADLEVAVVRRLVESPPN
jgi:lipoate---protein ligase